MAQPQSPDSRPTVIHPIELASFIQLVLHRLPGQVHLIVCSSQEEFLRQLLASIKYEKEVTVREAQASGVKPRRLARLAKRKHDLLVPTLRLLSNSSKVRVTFCETLPQLQAYLSVYEFKQDDSAKVQRSIALLNPISLHRDVSSFSAQGLSRTFASAIEAASRNKARLLVAECPLRAPRLHIQAHSEHQLASDDDIVLDVSDVDMHENVWDEEVSILNVATKSFGAGERGWVGRTVRIGDVVGRWCIFKDPRL